MTTVKEAISHNKKDHSQHYMTALKSNAANHHNLEIKKYRWGEICVPRMVLWGVWRQLDVVGSVESPFLMGLSPLPMEGVL